MHETEQRHDVEREGGFTLLEVSFALVLAVVMILALHQTVQVSVQGKQIVDRKYRVTRVADAYLTRLMEMPFGRATDPAPSAIDLSEFFDDDEVFGPLTLHQLRVAPSEIGQRFTMQTADLSGEWRVRVTNDIDGDGALTGRRDGRADLMRIEIFFENRLVLESMRAADPDFTTTDAVAGG